MKAHILIVEDESILYERLRRILAKENYTIDTYTPSVKDAIACINTKRPDIVLLDIDLQGEQTGIDLGKQLSETYKIPFIYVTQYGDNETFYKGLNTNHEHFIVKTKPRLNTGEILRTIQTVLKRNESKEPMFLKDGIMCYIDYLDRIKKYPNNTITRIALPFKKIAYFTTESFKNVNDELTVLKENYVRIEDNNGDRYFYKSSLKKIIAILPNYFVRISESTIINLSPTIFKGRINGSRLSVNNLSFSIKETYAKEVKKRLKSLYKI